MLYFDTSFLAPVVLIEPTSERIGAFIAALPADQPAASHWAPVEFASLLGRDVRMGRIESRAARQAEARFAALLDDNFELLLPSIDDYRQARIYLGNFDTGLRGPDALHLAVAANRQAEAIYTLDKGLLRAGRMLGLPVGTGIDVPGYEA